MHIYKGLYGERERAENCKKLLLKFYKNCLPELLQWRFLRVLEWFSSGFVAFPSSLNSTVCSLFQNFTKVGYSRRKPSRGRQLPTQHLSTESDPFCTEVPSLTTSSALCSIFSSNFSHRRGNLPGHASVFSDGTELPPPPCN